MCANIQFDLAGLSRLHNLSNLGVGNNHRKEIVAARIDLKHGQVVQVKLSLEFVQHPLHGQIGSPFCNLHVMADSGLVEDLPELNKGFVDSPPVSANKESRR